MSCSSAASSRLRMVITVSPDLPAALPSGALEPEVEAADAGEEGAEGGHVTTPSGSSV
jgi:hypothetical protein